MDYPPGVAGYPRGQLEPVRLAVWRFGGLA
jgi:hypothetical protein